MFHDPADDTPRCATCAHPRAVHEHNRPGTDCGRCGCDRYRLSVRDFVAHLVARRGTPLAVRS
ncbi:hypothetical protein ACI782_10805 [Geodermatophilus sp. SYSU D00703]